MFGLSVIDLTVIILYFTLSTSYLWLTIRKDTEKRAIYENIKMRTGGKQAIVGIARRTLLAMRRMLLDSQTYNIKKRSTRAA